MTEQNVDRSKESPSRVQDIVYQDDDAFVDPGRQVDRPRERPIVEEAQIVRVAAELDLPDRRGRARQLGQPGSQLLRQRCPAASDPDQRNISSHAGVKGRRHGVQRGVDTQPVGDDEEFLSLFTGHGTFRTSPTGPATVVRGRGSGPPVPIVEARTRAFSRQSPYGFTLARIRESPYMPGRVSPDRMSRFLSRTMERSISDNPEAEHWMKKGVPTMIVGELGNRLVVFGREDESVREAAKRMRDMHVGDLVESGGCLWWTKTVRSRGF